MLRMIKKLLYKFKIRRGMDIRDFSKIYGAYAEIVRHAWQDMMEQLEKEGERMNASEYSKNLKK